MKRKRSALELQAEIHRRIRDRWPADGECAGCRVAIPRRADLAHLGGNWNTEMTMGPASCAGAIDAIIREVRRDFDLA